MAKRLSDEERQVMAATGRSISDETQWFYEEVKKRRGKVKEADIKAIEHRAGLDMDSPEPEAEAEAEDDGTKKKKKKKKAVLIHLKDICKLMDWQFPRDKEVRNRLARLANIMLITSGDYGGPLLFQVVKRGLNEDVEDATDFFLSKKERRKAKKRRNLEEKHGVVKRREIKGHMTEDEKKAARKERARIRREAAKLGITTEEYKAQNATKEETPKEEPVDALPEPEVKEPKKKTTVKRKAPGTDRKKSTKKRSSRGNPKREAA